VVGQMLVIYFPPLQMVFQTEALTLTGMYVWTVVKLQKKNAVPWPTTVKMEVAAGSPAMYDVMTNRTHAHFSSISWESWHPFSVLCVICILFPHFSSATCLTLFIYCLYMKYIEWTQNGEVTTACPDVYFVYLLCRLQWHLVMCICTYSYQVSLSWYFGSALIVTRWVYFGTVGLH
jgi:hypothetical protein